MKDLRSSLLLLLFRGITGLLRCVPAPALVLFCRGFGRIAALFVPKVRAVSDAQLGMVFGAAPRLGSPLRTDTPGWERRATMEVFAHVGECVAEILKIDLLLEPVLGAQTEVDEERSGPDKAEPAMPALRRISSRNEDYVKRLVAGGTGAIALSGHLGCIELLAAYHIRCGVPLAVVGRYPNYEFLADWIRDVRATYGAEVIWRHDPAGARAILKMLKRGGIVAALIDQDVRLENVFSPFFGIPAAVPVALIRLAIARRIPILSSFIVRTGRLTHYVETEPILYDPEDANAEARILEIFHERLEALICRYPTQWIWWHRRWRRRPEIDYSQPGALRSTEDYLSWLEEMRVNGQGARNA